MTKNTGNPSLRSDSYPENHTFNIVYIAHNEVSVMSGSNDESRNGSGEGKNRGIKEYGSMSRIAKIPVIESTALAMSNFYSSVKQSHCIVQTMFENVEDGWCKSAEAVSPVTSKIEETLEGPLRVIDNAACVGLDFIEEKIPSVKLPPQEIFEKSKDYLNNQVKVPVVNFTSLMIDDFRKKLSQYAKSLGESEVDENNGDNNPKGNSNVANNDK